MNSECAVDTSRCPLCAGENQCTMAAGQSGERCWCTRVTLAAALLDRIPPALRGLSCVCPSCASAVAARGTMT